MDSSPLPIDAALPELTAALRANSAAVLVAPPGAGKTTRVPLILAAEPWAQHRQGDRILVLEPRRLAARAAAERMAHNLGEAVGETVGVRVRFGSKVSRKTRIEIVTEGIFTRMIVDDPMLTRVAAVERRKARVPFARARGRLSQGAPVYLRRSGAPPPSGRQRRTPGGPGRQEQGDLANRRLTPRGA